MLFFTAEKTVVLRRLIDMYEYLSEERIRTLNKFRKSEYVRCEKGHIILLRSLDRSATSILGKRTRRRLGEDVSLCPICGAKIVERFVAGIDVADVDSFLKKARQKYQQEIEKIVRGHPVYSYWLKHVKGVGPCHAGRLIYILESTRDLTAPSRMEKRCGLYVVAVCHRCRIYIEGIKNCVEYRCPLCGEKMTRCAVAKWLAQYRRYPNPYPAGAGPLDPQLQTFIYRLANELIDRAYIALVKAHKTGEVKHLDDAPVYGIIGLYKRYSEYLEARKLGLDEAQAWRHAISSSWRSLGRLILRHLWYVAVALKYGPSEELFYRTLPRGVVEGNIVDHIVLVPIIDKRREEAQSLYRRIMPESKMHLVALTWAKIEEMREKIYQIYTQTIAPQQAKKKRKT